MAKTADYTKRAVDNYRNKFDMYQLRLPKDSGLKERMKAAYGKDMNNIIIRLIEEDLERKANKSTQSIETHLYAPCDNAQQQDISEEDWSVGGRFKYNWINKELTQEEIDQLSQEERNDYYSYLAYLEMGQQAYDARVREDLENRKN